MFNNLCSDDVQTLIHLGKGFHKNLCSFDPDANRHTQTIFFSYDPPYSRGNKFLSLYASLDIRARHGSIFRDPTRPDPIVTQPDPTRPDPTRS